MPTRRTFDLILVTGLLVPPALGLVRSAARRWQHESTGAMETLGKAVALGLGR